MPTNSSIPEIFQFVNKMQMSITLESISKIINGCVVIIEFYLVKILIFLFTLMANLIPKMIGLGESFILGISVYPN